MNDFLTPIYVIVFLGGLYYFWHKCQIFAVSKFALLMGILIWPIGGIIGIYWAVKDYFLFRKSNTSEEIDFKVEKKKYDINKNSLKSDKLYLDALEEYESDKRDKALYARLYAENDGKEDLIKAKYITNKVKNDLEN